MAFWQAEAGGIRVAVKVQPKSRRPGLQGSLPDGARLRIGVSEAAEASRANLAACEHLSKALHQPASSVTVIHGATSRLKTLLVRGEPAILEAKMAALAAITAGHSS